MSKKFNKNLALIALVSTIALGGSPSLASAATERPAKAASARGWKLPTGSKMFMGEVSAINGSLLTISHPRASNTAEFIVRTDGSTNYLGETFSDIAIGTRISGVGTKQSDGSWTAASIRINPSMKAPIGKRQNNAGIRPFAGTIKNLDGSILSIDCRGTNTPRLINLTASTTFTAGSIANLTVGSSVAGIGTVNADKSINALKIHPNSDSLGMFRRGNK